MAGSKVVEIRKRALQSRDAIELLAEKWRIAILHILREGPLRNGQIQAAMDGVSPKVLTQTLRGMERDGLLKREVVSAVPARVNYELTAMGVSLIPYLAELCHWAKAHVAERDEARREYDGRAGNGAVRAKAAGEGG